MKTIKDLCEFNDRTTYNLHIFNANKLCQAFSLHFHVVQFIESTHIRLVILLTVILKCVDINITICNPFVYVIITISIMHV